MEKIIICIYIVFALYVGVLIMICCDLWSGIRKAKERGEFRRSSGYRRTIDKICKYYNALIALSVIDGMQMSGAWYLAEIEGYNLPLFPFVTMLGAIGVCLIEVKSIYEKADEKERNDINDVGRAMATLLKHHKPAEIAAVLGEYIHNGNKDDKNEGIN